jgi:hypothetical protein
MRFQLKVDEAMSSTVTGTAFPLGYYGSNPDGSSASGETQFQSQYDAFVQAMGGVRPQFMDAYVDFSQDPANWGANMSWSAWSWAQSGNSYVGPGSGTIPVVGVPMYSTSGGWPGTGGEDVDTFYQQITSGQYDADYKSLVDAWANQGYKTIYMRLGYEFDGNFMSWSPGNSGSPSAVADFVKAWQHLANLVHAEGQTDGTTVKTVWNPSDINWTGYPVASAYPGNQYVDVISSDTYSDNMQQYQSETATGANPGSGWSLPSTIAFAKQQGKPIAMSETGATSSDPSFPQWLSTQLQQAQSAGAPVSFVNVWDSNSGGSYQFSGSGSNAPQLATAWDQYFGAGSGSSGGSPTTGGGSSGGGSTSTGGGSSSSGGGSTSTGGGSSDGNTGGNGGGTTSGTSVGSGPDTLVLDISEDRYANGDGTSDASGDSTFVVFIDGKQFGGTFTATAMHAQGQTEPFTFKGYFGPGNHSVEVQLTNDAWSGVESPTTDRNIYVDSVTYNGVSTGYSGEDMNGEGAWLNVSGGTAPPPPASTITTQSGQSTSIAIVGNTASVTTNGATTQDKLSGAVTINANGSDKITIDKTSTVNLSVNGSANRLNLTDAGSGNLTFTSGSGNVTLVGGSGTNNVALGACKGGNVFFDGNMTVTGGSSGPFNWEFTKGDPGTDVIPYKIGHDTIVLNGYGTDGSTAITSNNSAGGNTTLVLSDNTHITLTGVAHLSNSSIVLH